MREIWADIENYEGLYQASNFGNIKSLPNKNHKDEKILNPTINSSGYLKVELYKNRKAKDFYVHRLVASTFLPNPDNKPQINHRDGNKSNNSISNLEWVTASENQKHSIEHGLHAPSPMKNKVGKLNPNSKPIIQYDYDGNFIRVWDSPYDAAKALNIQINNIRACVNGYHHSSAGFIWKPYQPNYSLKVESLESIYLRNMPKRKGIHKRQLRINQFTKNGKLIKQWGSLKEISDNTDFNTNVILRNVNGRRHTAYGFIWEKDSD